MERHLPSALSSPAGKEAWADWKSLTCVGRADPVSRKKGFQGIVREEHRGLELPGGGGLQPCPRLDTLPHGAAGPPLFQEPHPPHRLFMWLSCPGFRPRPWALSCSDTRQNKVAIHCGFSRSSRDTVSRTRVCLLN